MYKIRIKVDGRPYEVTLQPIRVGKRLVNVRIVDFVIIPEDTEGQMFLHEQEHIRKGGGQA
jgi:hypothetical protein